MGFSAESQAGKLVHGDPVFYRMGRPQGGLSLMTGSA